MKTKPILKIIASILLCQSAGIIGSIFTAPNIQTWYTTLNKPAFNPPGWIFGPVWLSLYTLMGIALYLVWKRKGENRSARQATNLFLIHLIFNAAWSIIFFGLHQLALAFVCIATLWLMIIALIILFHKIDKRAAYLLIPYLFWVSFASLLNFSIWVLN